MVILLLLLFEKSVEWIYCSYLYTAHWIFKNSADRRPSTSQETDYQHLFVPIGSHYPPTHYPSIHHIYSDFSWLRLVLPVFMFYINEIIQCFCVLCLASRIQPESCEIPPHCCMWTVDYSFFLQYSTVVVLWLFLLWHCQYFSSDIYLSVFRIYSCFIFVLVFVFF